MMTWADIQKRILWESPTIKENSFEIADNSSSDSQSFNITSSNDIWMWGVCVTIIDNDGKPLEWKEHVRNWLYYEIWRDNGTHYTDGPIVLTAVNFLNKAYGFPGFLYPKNSTINEKINTPGIPSADKSAFPINIKTQHFGYFLLNENEMPNKSVRG